MASSPAAGVGPAALIPVPNPIGSVTTVVGGGLASGFADLLRTIAAGFLHDLAAPVARYLVHTPDLMAQPTLQREWLVALGCLLATAVLLVAIAGAAMATGSTHRLGQAARHAVGVRLAVGVLTAAVSLPLVALEVQLANTLVGALLPGVGAGPLWRTLQAAVTGSPSAGIALLVTAVVGVVLLVLLVVLSLARWATLWLLVVLAPIAMGFAMLPGAADVARVWWRLQVAAVFLPVTYAVLLGTYAAMFGSARGGLVGALSGVALLALMTKLPAWAAGTAVGVDSHEIGTRFRRAHRHARGWLTAQREVS